MIKVSRYFKPQTVNEALEIMADSTNIMKILAGGTDLVLELKEGNRPLDIVDIGGLQPLRSIREDEARVVIGSLVTFSQLQQSATVFNHCRALAQAAALVGSPQIRNQGTIGGNIANASPAADLVPCLVAMDAEILVVNKRSQRLVKISDLLKGANQTDVAPDELILEISFAKLPMGSTGFAKLGKRNALAISRISAAIAIQIDHHDRIWDARVALGSVAPNPFRSTLVETALIGKSRAGGVTEDVLEAVTIEVAEKLGTRASAPYKRKAIRGVVRQALERVFSC